MNTNVNKKHKSSVFSAVFSNPHALRELYSAIEGVDISPDTVIEINTLSDVIYMEQLNDISFTIDDRIVVLIEHQSTISENIPLRLFMYLARVYEKIIDKVQLYKKKMIKIPAPELIVLYNGREPYPDQLELNLSAAFKNIDGYVMSGKDVPLELTVQVYNINHGRNPQILEKSLTLNSYGIFIKKINEFKTKMSLEKAVEMAIKYCIEHNILEQFLKDNGSEVYNMLNEEPTMEEIINIRVQEEVEECMIKRDRSIAMNALAKGSTPEFVQEITGLDIETVRTLANSIS